MVSSNSCVVSQIKFIPSKYNLLIIEDSKSLNKVLTRQFTMLGYNCFNVMTLKEADEILENNDIHYLILDINLPDGNGYELIKRLENTPEKIFVLTDEKDRQLIEQSYQKGVIDFIIKDKSFFHKMGQINKTIEQLEKNKDKTILIVDDSFIIREQLKDLLTNRHYNIKEASTTKEAYEIIKNEHLDLILLDVQLKDENGIEFLEEHRHEIISVKKIPVLIISGQTEASTVRNSLKAGASDVLQKPYITEELILKVDLWIDYKRKNEELSCSIQLLSEYKDTVDRSSIVSKTNEKGIITYVNEEFCKISGYSQEELLGQPHNIVRHPDNPKEIYKNLWKTIKEDKKPWKGELKNKNKDGESYWVKTIINPIVDDKDNILEFIAIRTDITDQMTIKEHFEKELNISSKKLSSTLKLSKEYEYAINESNILTRYDLDKNITYVNDKFVEITGYTKEELIGSSYKVFQHPDMPKQFYKKAWKTVKKGKVWNGIVKNIKKDGSTYWVDSTVVPIKDENEEIVEYMAIRHDLTELFELHKEIEDTQKEIIYKMGEIGESRSKETGNHVKRVALYSKLLAQLHGLDEDQCELLFTASPMHDIGKVGIPDSILKKPGKLTAEEFETMKGHSIIGKRILSGSNRPVLDAAKIVAYEHHEKWDGSGYPRGIKGEDIHIFGRITAIADVFDALGSQRVYKDAWKLDDILALFEKESGSHFDPKLIELFQSNLDKFLEIRDTYQD